MILANTALVLLFVFFNWVGYEMLSVNGPWDIESYSLFYIYGQSHHSPMVTGFEAFILPNYQLAIFLISTIVNLYFIFKLSNK